jgi:predicted Zn-dependent peptidase
VDAEGGIHYPVGDLFDYNGPTLMVTRILHKPEYSVDQTIAAYDQIIDEMKEKGITAEELEPIKVKFRSNYFSMLEGGASIPRYGLMHLLACFSLFDNDPKLVNTILGGFMQVTPEAVQTVAQKLLTRHSRSIAIRQPVKKGAA